jgi:hypothetical protein
VQELKGADTGRREPAACLPACLPARWGFLGWGSGRRGIPGSDFLSQLLLYSCSAAPSPPEQAG